VVHEVIMPALGMAQDTGLLVSWQKSVGDAVGVEDVLMEVETDKSTMEVPAGRAGYVAELRAQAGQDIPVGQVIALITAQPPDLSAPSEPIQPTQPDEPAKVVQSMPAPEKAQAPVPPPATLPIDAPQSQGSRILASPKARRLAAEAGLDISALQQAGLPQPYHAADIEKLRDLAAPAQSHALNYGPLSSHITATVPAGALDAFIVRMRDEGGIELTFGDIAVAFSGVALRQAVGGDALSISLRGPDGGRQVYTDPDKYRLSHVAGVASDAPTQLEIREVGSGYLTTIAIGDAKQPVLAISRGPDTMNLSLTFSDAPFGADQAIELMRGLTQRLADPLLALA